jgi:hypothetical protein
MKKISSSLLLALLLFAAPIVGKAMHDIPPPDTKAPTTGRSSPAGFDNHENATTNIASSVAVQILTLLVQMGVIP